MYKSRNNPNIKKFRIYAYLIRSTSLKMGFPGGKLCRRLGFDPWAKKIPWRRKWQLTLAWEISWTESLSSTGDDRLP